MSIIELKEKEDISEKVMDDIIDKISSLSFKIDDLTDRVDNKSVIEFHRKVYKHFATFVSVTAVIISITQFLKFKINTDWVIWFEAKHRNTQQKKSKTWIFHLFASIF